MADNTDLLALMGDLIRATDRQTAENKRNIDELRADIARIDEKFTTAMTSFAAAVAHGFERVDKKLDSLNERVDGLNERVDGLTAEVRETNRRVDVLTERVDTLTGRVDETNRRLDVVIEHTGHLTEKVDSIDRRLYHIEQDLPNYLDVVRRLTVLETIVLPKAS